MTDIVERLRSWHQDVSSGTASLEMSGSDILDLKEAADEIERLQEALEDCAGSLEKYVEHEYEDTKDYPSIKRKYEQDMEDVYRARALLKVEDKDA
jgi:hypothetical protein